MRRYWSAALVVVALLIGLLVTVAPLSQTQNQEKDLRYSFRFGCPQPENYDYCPARYESLNPEKETYELGEEVKLIFSNLKDFEYLVEKVEVHFKPLFEHEFELFYVEKEVGPIKRERNEWVWVWDQKNSAGEVAGPGRFYVRITLNCCRNYRTYFRVSRTGGGGVELQPPEEVEEAEVRLPESPGSLTTRILSPSEIRLSWQDNSDNESGFRIYRNGNEIATVGANVTAYTDTGLQEGKSYTYRVASYNQSGESSLSGSRRIKTSVSVSEPPGSLSSRVLSPSEIRLSWQDNSDNESGFRIYRNGNPIATVNANTTSFTDTGLASDTDYTYRISSYNAGGESTLSGPLRITTPVEVSVSPGGLSSRVISPTEIELTWQDNSENEDGFRVYRNGKKIAEVGANTTSYVDTGLEENTNYTYRVASFNEAGESSFSSGLQLTTPVGVPSSPGRLRTETISPTRIKLTWQDNSDNESGFRIYRNGNTVGSVGANTTSYIHRGLESETRYCYQIVAYNSSGESGTTNRNCSMTLKSIPDLPKNVKATPLTSSEIKLSWKDDSDNEDGFRVYRNGVEIATLGPNTTSYVDTGLGANESYSYEVSAYNDSGESGLSGSGSVTTPRAEAPEPDQGEAVEEGPSIGQRELLAGIGIVVMVMGYIYSEMGG